MTTITPLVPEATPLLRIPTARLHPSPENRDVGDCAGLTASVAEVGVLQPILVTHDADLPEGDWRIVAGERRWTAATNAGLADMPALDIEDLSPVTRAELRLIENLHRKDLDPLEEGEAFAELVAFGRKQKEIAATASCGQPHVSKMLSLLTLPDPAKDALREDRITQRTALAIVPLVKDTPRISRILRALEGDSSPDVYDRIVQTEIHEATRDKDRAARTKAINERAAKLEADGLEQLAAEGDPFYDGWLVRDDDDELPATAFSIDLSFDRVPQDVTLWRRPTAEEAADIAKANAERDERLQRNTSRDWEQEQFDRDARRAFMVELLRQTPATLIDPAAFVVHGLIDYWADVDDYELLEDTLKLLDRYEEPAEGDEVDDARLVQQLHELADESGDGVLLAIVLANRNVAWGSPHDAGLVRLINFLEANGYTPPATGEEVSGEEVAEAGASPADAEGSAVPSVASEPETVAGEDATLDTTTTDPVKVKVEGLAGEPAENTARVQAAIDAATAAPRRGVNETDPALLARAAAGHAPWAGYDGQSDADVIRELDMATTSDEVTARVMGYERANESRMAVIGHCVWLLATSRGDLEPGAMCQVCGLRAAVFGSTELGTAECEKCDDIEKRRVELRKESATQPGVKREAEIRLEMDGLFVDQFEVQPGDQVHADGSITRAESVDAASAAR